MVMLYSLSVESIEVSFIAHARRYLVYKNLLAAQQVNDRKHRNLFPFTPS